MREIWRVGVVKERRKGEEGGGDMGMRDRSKRERWRNVVVFHLRFIFLLLAFGFQ